MKAFATVLEAGRTVRMRAYHYSTMPRERYVGVGGTLNGKPYRFHQTHSTNHFYVYFQLDDSVWYLDMSGGYLSEGAAVEFPAEDAA